MVGAGSNFNSPMIFSLDPTLLIWQISPLSKEVLFLMSSFSLASPPSLLVSTKSRLCVARNDPERSSFTIDMFDIANQGEFSTCDSHVHTCGLSSVALFS